MRDFIFHNNTRIIFGKGQAQAAGQLASAHLGKNILLLLGGNSARKSGLYAKIAESLAASWVAFHELWGVTPNPDISKAREGVSLCRREGVDGILAVGGGSVIDCAKAIAAACRHDGDAWDLFSKKIKPENPLPVGAVLTLSATGSEANGNSVMSNSETEEKFAWYHPQAYPVFSVLDPALTFTLPAEQTAYGAVDIMSHVFEQFFHDVEGTDIQDGLAISLMRAVIKNAPEALANPEDFNARANLMWGSTLALNGLLGAGALGDWTCHMLEHELSAKHGLAHGAGLAIVFPAWMRLVGPGKAKRFRLFLEKVWDVSTAGVEDDKLGDMAAGAVSRFFRDDLKIGVRMSDYGVDSPRITEMVDSLLTYKKPENLGGLGRDGLQGIYEDAR